MKKILLIPALLFAFLFSHSQYIYKIKADSVLITNDSCTAELNLENSTKDTLGFLYNTGNGRTRFKKALIKINDSVYLIGPDTLYIPRAQSTVPISKLIAATTTNTINNTNYAQEWQWNSLGAGTALKLSSSSPSAASNLQRLLEVSLTDTTFAPSQTTVAGHFSNLHKGTGSNMTNVALEAIADSGANNWAGRFTGNIHLNGTNPAVSFLSGTFSPTDIYIRRSGTAMITQATGTIVNQISGVEVSRVNHGNGHYWLTGTPTALIRAVIKPNGNFIVGASVDSGALFQVNGGATINGSLTLGQRQDGPSTSLLTMESNSKGFLRPRMTNTQRNAISSPPAGLSVYNTTLNTNDTYNGSEYFSFGSQIKVPSTVTAGGTTGNQTINKISGTVNIAAAGTTVTVTNSLVSANSLVYAVLRTNDATASIKNVVPGAGTFTINLAAAATAETSIGFIVFN